MESLYLENTLDGGPGHLIHHFHALDEVERFSEQLLEDLHIREHLFNQVLEFFGFFSMLHPVKATNISKV